ncbi:hypothetical protein ACFL2V_08925 [Pseudomonadota bacterium]
MNEASELTGLSDWGDDENFKDALTIILDSCRESSNFPEMGWQMAHGHITKCLTNRLLIQESTKQDTTYSDEKISKPLIIVSLPRNG